MSDVYKAKVTIMIGSGGVGKTTVAAAYAYKKALQGKKVLVLTIDPSQRLAQTLGLKAGSENVEVVLPAHAKGSLHASLLDHKKVFDEFIRRTTGDVDKGERILKNRLYHQLSTALSGSQEFTSLELLYTAFESNKYDEIVLDTPPAKHAIDFLRAPLKLSRLFNDKVTKWFRRPDVVKSGIIGRIFSAGADQVLKVLEVLTGGDFVKELAEFFGAIESWQEPLSVRTKSCHELLLSRQTQFFLVTSFEEAKLKEAEQISQEIRGQGYHLNQLILNRCFPFWLNTDLSQIPQKLQPVFLQMRLFFEQKEVATEIFSKSLGRRVEIARIPDLVDDVSRLDSLESLCQYLP